MTYISGEVDYKQGNKPLNFHMFFSICTGDASYKTAYTWTLLFVDLLGDSTEFPALYP